MSAYIVNPEVIAVLASFAAEKADLRYGNTYQYPDLTSAGMIAAALAKENIRSISHRYPDTIGNEAPAFMPGYETNEQYIADCFNMAEAKPHRSKTLDFINDLVREYDYQSCETENWYETKAWNICVQIRASIAQLSTDQLAHRAAA